MILDDVPWWRFSTFTAYIFEIPSFYSIDVFQEQLQLGRKKTWSGLGRDYCYGHLKKEILTLGMW